VIVVESSDGRRRAASGRRDVLAAALLWSMGGLVTKLLGLDGATVAFYRGLFAGLALLPFVPRSRRVFRPGMIPMVAIFGAMTGLYLASVMATTAANAIFLQYTSTFWVIPIGALVLGERPDRRSAAGIALATVGIAGIVLYGYRGPEERAGIVMGLASGVGYAAVTVGMRGFRGLDPLWLSGINNLGGALVLGAWIGATSGRIPVPSPGQALALFAFGVVQMAVPYALFARGLREIGAPEAGLISLLEPVLGPIWVFLALGERPERPTLIGGAFLLAGVALRYLPTEGPKRPEASPGPPGPIDGGEKAGGVVVESRPSAET
jgi:drug/metabolite transporter, DME family